MIYYCWESWFDIRVGELTPQYNTARMMTMMYDFQVTQVEEIQKQLQSDVKEYVLGLAEVFKIPNEEYLDEVTRYKLM